MKRIAVIAFAVALGFSWAGIALPADVTEGTKDPGPVDGLMGPKTRAAVQDFQRKEGLEASASPRPPRPRPPNPRAVGRRKPGLHPGFSLFL